MISVNPQQANPTPDMTNAAALATGVVPPSGDGATPTGPQISQMGAGQLLSAGLTPPPKPAAPSATTAPAVPAAPTPAQQALGQQVVKHAAFGQGIKHMLSALYGGHTEYNVNPETGQMETTQVKEPPGQIWKHILAGAIVGGAAASETHAQNPYMGPGAGFVVGAGAEQKAQWQQNQLRRKQAQENFEEQQKTKAMSLEERRVVQEELSYRAQAELWKAQEIVSATTSNLNNQKEVDEQNEQSRLLLDKILTEHGSEAPLTEKDPTTGKEVPLMGIKGNYQKLMDFANEHPEVLHPANGDLRIPVKTIDTTELHYDINNHGWLDANNEPANLEDHTIWHVYDLPKDSANQTVTLTGAEISKAFPGQYPKLPAANNYTLPFVTVISMLSNARKQQNESTRESVREDQERLDTTVRALESALSGTETQLKLAVAQDENSEEVQSLKAKLGDYREQLDSTLQEINPQIRHFYEKNKAANVAKQGIPSTVVADPNAWAQLRPGETLMIDPQGRPQAVPNGKVDKAIKQNYVRAVNPIQAAAAKVDWSKVGRSQMVVALPDGTPQVVDVTNGQLMVQQGQAQFVPPPQTPKPTEREQLDKALRVGNTP